MPTKVILLTPLCGVSLVALILNHHLVLRVTDEGVAALGASVDAKFCHIILLFREVRLTGIGSLFPDTTLSFLILLM